MASHVLEAVDKRLGGASARGSHVTLGGQRMNLSGDLPPQAGPGRRPAIHSPTLFGPAWDERAGLTYGYRDMSMRDFNVEELLFRINGYACVREGQANAVDGLGPG